MQALDNVLIGVNDIGGGFVRRLFVANGATMKVGTPLSSEKIKSFKNWHMLVKTGTIAVYPPAPASGVRHVVHNGGGRFDVIVGHKLNDLPLTREQAEELAASGGN